MDNKNKPVIIVKAIKKFEYPKGMLNREQPFEQAINLAKRDMELFISEVIHNDHANINANHFTFEVTDQLGHKFRLRNLPEVKNSTINIDKAANYLATKKIEQEFGELNYELNPGIYDHIVEVRDPYNNVIIEESWYLKLEVEEKFFSQIDYFTNVLHLAKNN